MSRWKRFAIRLAAVLAIVFVAIQFIPVDRVNPPVEGDLQAPPEIAAILRRSCYDCHSNETNWPWYSRIAPVSWLTAKDVREGRKEMNFSTWNRLSGKKQSKALEECWEEIEDGEMPPWIYLTTHPEARLSSADRALLKPWLLGH